MTDRPAPNSLDHWRAVGVSEKILARRGKGVDDDLFVGFTLKNLDDASVAFLMEPPKGFLPETPSEKPKALLPESILSKPDINKGVDSIMFSWAAEKVSVELNRFVPDRDSDCEISVIADGKALHWGRLRLSSTSKREEIVRKLKGHPFKHWTEVLEVACRQGADFMRDQAPPEPLYAQARSPDFSLIDNLIYRGQPSILVAPGDAGKTWLMLYLSALAATGKEFRPFRVRRPLRALYLDWERSATIFADRLARIRIGLGMNPIGSFDGLMYKKMVKSLPESVADIKAWVQRNAIDFLVLDAAGLAMGGEVGEADSTLRFYASLSKIGIASLTGHHVNKADTLDGSGHRRLSAYGSVYFENESYKGWSLEPVGDQIGTTKKRLLRNDVKHNDEDRYPDVGVLMDWREGGFRMTTFDPKDDPDTSEKLAAEAVVLSSLMHAGKGTAKDISDRTGREVKTIKNALTTLKRKRLADHEDVSGREEALWYAIDMRPDRDA